MEFILVGQPNSGKSTIFNEVIGYKSDVSNFPGITVEYTSGQIDIENEKIKVTDLPGIYSMQSTDDAELAAATYLLNAADNAVIINIIDSSVLSRSLELTLQIMELQKPMVVALNMMDETEKKGISIDKEKLSEILGIPVVATIGRKGKGVFDLFKAAYGAGIEKIFPNVIEGPADIEKVYTQLIDFLKKKKIPEKWDFRLMISKLLEKDPVILDYLNPFFKKKDRQFLEKTINDIEKNPDRSTDFIISSVRHDTAFNIFENVARLGAPLKKDIRQKIDSVLMHPLWGYLFMIGILYSTFRIIFVIADTVEPIFTVYFESIIHLLADKWGEGTLLVSISKGIIHGLGGGITIAVSYLLPFFIMLSVLEDTGYLARIAFLIDNVMHRIGLHGMSIIPIVLGYGCSVPAVMATRILKSPRDRLITATLTTLVPCSARMVIILGLIGAIFSIEAAIMIYILNIIILGLTGKLMSRAMPEVSPGLIMEVPKYHLPHMKALFKKTWFRLKEFVVIALPLLVVGSIVLEIIGHYHLTAAVNTIFAPFTAGVLGLPPVVGVVLLFGIMRKELALLLLASALGIKETSDILNAMTPTQIYTFTVFATFYIPCIATIAALAREFNWRKAGLITLLTFLVAVFLSLLIRLGFPLFLH